MHQIEAKKAGFVSIVKRREHKLFEILKNIITNVCFFTLSVCLIISSCLSVLFGSLWLQN